MQAITINPIKTNNLSSHKNVTKQTIESAKTGYSMKGANILANQNIAFMSIKKPPKSEEEFSGVESLPLPEYDKDLVADEPEGHFSFYLRNNPEAFYVNNKQQINKFLKSGALDPILEREEDVDPKFRELVREDVNKVKDYNRAIVDSVGILDSLMMERTTEPIVLYSHAPKSWMETAKDGKLKTDGFFPTSLSRNGLRDSTSNPKNTSYFEVWIPENMPYIDLTDKGELEMLFPRGLEFKIIDDKSLEMVLKK